MSFSKDFVWGAAAASYQIEGAAFVDGKGLSIWDNFSHTPGKVWQNETGDVACDHYHRFVEDIALMKEIGLQAYRLSVSWSRILPKGTGEVNQKGLDFYTRLVDELLAAEITPYITLFHWDYPYELYCRGSWQNRDSADWFADYVGVVVNALGDRVKHWFTLNEPAVFTIEGYEIGEHAPGDKHNKRDMMHIIHHVLLAHGKGVQAIRTASKDAEVSIAVDMGPVIPVEDTDLELARIAQWQVKHAGLWSSALWLDPILKGEYPDEALERWGDYLPIQAGDLENMNQALDFIGLNIYRGTYVNHNEEGKLDIVPEAQGRPVTMMDWNVTPEALYWGPKFTYERYGLPVAITENGLASMDWVAVDGHVHDANRIDFLTRYLREYQRAAADGVALAGYFHWSILDNFEWAEGYRKRFGLIHVDYPTQQRILKDSAYWYQSVISTNGENLTS